MREGLILMELPRMINRSAGAVFPTAALPLGAALLCALILGRPAIADPAQSQPCASSHPLLDQINHETQGLYEEVRGGVARVQLPSPKWVNDSLTQENPLNKWNLDPGMREQLTQQQRLVLRGVTITARAPATRPTTAPSDDSYGRNTIIVLPPPQYDRDRDPQPAKLGMQLNDNESFNPRNVGLLLDDKGYVLVPMYVEREAVGDAPVKLTLGGEIAEAKFVGSDRQTSLTVLQLNKPAGKPVRLRENRPQDGSLVLYISPVDASGRLALWTASPRDTGIVVTTDGNVAGIARGGQFLSGSSCRLIADQIIRFGAVKRATLGVMISEIRKDSPLREQLPALGRMGGKTAMRVDQVLSGSAADKAGLKPGDLLLALSGEAVSDIPSFAAAISARSGKTELQVLRGSDVLNVTVELQQK